MGQIGFSSVKNGLVQKKSKRHKSTKKKFLGKNKKYVSNNILNETPNNEIWSIFKNHNSCRIT
jgi:hypothetical protein